jgi:hypothetical protein
MVLRGHQGEQKSSQGWSISSATSQPRQCVHAGLTCALKTVPSKIADTGKSRKGQKTGHSLALPNIMQAGFAVASLKKGTPGCGTTILWYFKSGHCAQP